MSDSERLTRLGELLIALSRSPVPTICSRRSPSTRRECCPRNTWRSAWTTPRPAATSCTRCRRWPRCRGGARVPARRGPGRTRDAHRTAVHDARAVDRRRPQRRRGRPRGGRAERGARGARAQRRADARRAARRLPRARRIPRRRHPRREPRRRRRRRRARDVRACIRRSPTSAARSPPCSAAARTR